jgi:heptosyltransferase-2
MITPLSHLHSTDGREKALGTKQQKILVVQTAFLGDLILYFSLFKEIKRLFNSSELHIVVRSGFGHFAVEQGVADFAYEIKKGDAASYRRVKEKLRQQDWDFIFCPHPSLRSALLVSGLRAKRKIGFANFWNGLFFSDRVNKPQSTSEVVKALSLLTPISKEWSLRLPKYLQLDFFSPGVFGELPGIPPELLICEPPSKEGGLVGQSGGQRQRGRVAIFPGSVWPTKRWKKEYFAEIAGWLFEQKKAQVYWMGSGDEARLCRELTQAVPGTIFFETLASERKSSLSQVVEFLKTVELVISNDSGGQHLAALAGPKVLTLFGPTVLSQGFSPWVARASVAELSGLKCRPCGAHGHRVCPLKTHECMEKLLPGRVKQVIEHLIVSP